ncbi:MAG: RepB family plasmid replication initiator protein [Gemmatimonadetes bacterium]|nr:MAG: RepB family plasmid replication initiator protein [Gemmatimonadota bacterium]
MTTPKREELLVLTKDEMNLAEFPFALLTQRQTGDQATIKFSRYIKDRNSGKLVKQEWIVTGAEEYGLPIAIDYDVYLALMKLWKDQNFEGDRIYFTRYQLLKLLRWNTSKREYDRLERSLDRLKTVSIKAKRAFWDNKAKKYVTRNVNLFAEYHLYEEKAGKKKKNDGTLPLSYIVVSPALVESVRNGFIRSVDIDKYLAMRTPLTKRLYRFLSKMRYNHYPEFKMSLQELADLLPIRDKRPSHLKRTLKRAHDQLRDDFDFLSDVCYRTENGDLKIIYRFAPARNAIEVKSQVVDNDEAEEFSETETTLIEALIQRKITPKAAAGLVKTYSPDRIKEKIAVYDWMVQVHHRHISQNPQGYLRKSIEDDYKPPSDYAEPTPPPSPTTPDTATGCLPSPPDPLLDRFRALPADKQEEILKEAVAQLDDFLATQYQKHGLTSLAVKAAVEDNIRQFLSASST